VTVLTSRSPILDRYLLELVEQRGSDLHLTAGAPPLLRIDGELRPLDHPSLDAEAVEAIVMDTLTTELVERLRINKTVDFAFGWEDQARFRANVFTQRGSYAMAVRFIPYAIPTMDSLGLPAIAGDLVQRHQGLVLVTGPTGSGKSTTLASMIGWINQNRPLHILTIEDPLEYVHRHERGIVNQRELGPDAETFPDALRSALREDPDVVLIGEMRDLDTIRTCLTIAETGHLVFATLHTNDTAQAIDRIVDVFPAEQQTQIKVQLANALQAVIYQRLVPRPDGGRVAAFEVLAANNAVRNLILEGKTRQLRNQITTGQQDKMQTFEAHLNQLVREEVITFEDARSRSLYPKELELPPPPPSPEERLSPAPVSG